MRAAGRNDAKKVTELLSDQKLRRQLDLNAAMFEASDNNSGATLELLVHAGADLESRRFESRATALISAIHSRRDEMVLKLLLLGADIRAKDSTGMTAYDRMINPTCHGDIVQWSPETLERAKAAYANPVRVREDSKEKAILCPMIRYEDPNWRWKVSARAHDAPSIPVEPTKAADGAWELVCEGTLKGFSFDGHIEEKTGEVTEFDRTENLGHTVWGFENYRCPKLKAISARTSRFVEPSDAPRTKVDRKVPDTTGGGGQVYCKAEPRKARMLYRVEEDVGPIACRKTETGFSCTYP